jgi:hypothetical protein
VLVNERKGAAMTSFFQSVSRQSFNRQSFSGLSFAGCGAAFTGTSQAAGDSEAEYHVVFATMTAALIAGCAVVLAALSHAV